MVCVCFSVRVEPSWLCGIVFRKTDLERVADLVFGGLLYGIYGLYYFPVKGLLTIIIDALFRLESACIGET